MIPQPLLDGVIAEAWGLMAEIGRLTAAEPGITRAAFGEGEQIAADLVCRFAAGFGLAPEHDAFGNITFLLPGADPALPAITSGSHLDSVPNGGNFDGLAGTAAALAVLAATRKAGIMPPRSLRALAMRGEESPWFNMAYLGSRLLLAHGDRTALGERRRIDSGLTLREHVDALGFPFRTDATPLLTRQDTACFIELHIEQGPLLEEKDLALGVASAIRGNFRYPQARCVGEYGHASTTPRHSRRDAVMAVAELAIGLDALWAELAAAGDDNFVVTFGRFSTDPAQHALTKVPGEVSFSLNVGSTSEATLRLGAERLDAMIARIAATRGVRFEMGPRVTADPVALDPGVTSLLERQMEASGLPVMRLPTAGHDAGIFALSGIPSAMLLTRNPCGSHNPRETLLESDFAMGCTVLARAMHVAAAGPPD
ncbi:hydantoinase/carbamoylase family amidase [Roseomonas sp. HJA6]|uniref:Hydantoinase/carbamoylase family amidase n=1 Tax=Roseomonas alba TaxID=2846776 RepID=A0ABS7A7C8_9PROT|nr:hydantoinase/carbamoylase family amidase [Neoroseomonas alba]